MRIPLGKEGVIQHGDWQGWRVEVEEDELSPGGFSVTCWGLEGRVAHFMQFAARNQEELHGFFETRPWRVSWNVTGSAIALGQEQSDPRRPHLTTNQIRQRRGPARCALTKGANHLSGHGD